MDKSVVIDGKRMSNGPMKSLNGRIKDYLRMDMDIQISKDLEIE